MKYSDLIIYSHAIFDAVGDRPFPGAVAVKGKTIQYVGTREGAQTLIGPDTVIRDFGNGLVTPGFCDSHIHFNGAAARCGTLKLRIPQETASEEECVRLLRAFADEHPGRPYYSGGGWNFVVWGDGAGLPTFRSLDRAFPDIPVTFMSADSHTCWMNSAAMEVCNIEEMAKDFPPEWCVRDENGRPTGIAKEEFSLAVPSRIARELHSETIDSETEKSQLKFIEEMNSVGITSVDDVSFAEVDEMDTLYGYLRKFDESDTLSLRVNIYMGTRRDKNRIAAVLPEVRRWQSDRLRVAGLKEALDGVPNTWTAALLAPYSDRPDTCGELKSTGDEYKAWMTEANRLGLITRTHCVGDAAVRTALDACEGQRAEVQKCDRAH